MINSVCGGSTGRICLDTMRALSVAGHTARLWYGRGNAPEGTEARRFSTDSEVYWHALLARITDRQGFCGSRAATNRLIGELSDFQPDIIQLHQPHGYYLHLPTLFSYFKRSGVPVVWTLHDCWTMTGHCAYFDAAHCSKWRSKCGGCSQTHAYPEAFVDRSQQNILDKRTLFSDVPKLNIVTPSNWLNDLARETYLKQYPIVTIHNGTDRTVFRPTENESIRPKKNGDKLILGAANVWEPRKGLDTFRALRNRLGENERILLVGLSPKQIAALPAGIDGVTRTADAHEMAALYTAADVFVDATREDNFPTTHIEALACGTPVVTYAVGGCAEALDAHCGIAVPKEDLSAMTDAIRRAYTFRAEDCLQRAAAFDKDDAARAYLALYESILRGGTQ